jgi:hypothetical protein
MRSRMTWAIYDRRRLGRGPFYTLGAGGAKPASSRQLALPRATLRGWEPTMSGKRLRVLVIDEPAASEVQRIFADFLAGCGRYAIAERNPYESLLYRSAGLKPLVRRHLPRHSS